MKKLVIGYTKKSLSKKIYSLDDDPQMYKTYYDLFNLFNKNGLDIYICKDINNMLSNQEFDVIGKYDKTTHFEPHSEKVIADIYWDKTSLYAFPLPCNKLHVDLLNIMEFKLISDDKWLSYLNFKEYFPKTILLADLKEITNYLELIKSNKFVIKPLSDFGGKGISCFLKSDKEGLSRYIIEHNVTSTKFIIQEFCDVSSGIKGLVEGIHDIRIMITNNKIIFSYIRKPSSPNEFRTNYSIGGSLKEVDPKDIPSEIVSFIKPIMKDAYENYKNPFFSIDLFMTKSGPKIVEITGANVGFPTPDMNLKSFYNNLVERFCK